MKTENYNALDKAVRELSGCFTSYHESGEECKDVNLKPILNSAYDLGKLISSILDDEKPA